MLSSYIALQGTERNQRQTRCIVVQELEGQVQGMHLPDNVEKAWKDVEQDLSENPVSKGVESLQKLTDPSVRAVCCRCDCLIAVITS